MGLEWEGVGSRPMKMVANLVVLQARFEVRKSLAKVRATAKA